MKTIRRTSCFYAVALTASVVVPMTAQASPFACTATVSVPPVARVEGDAEPMGDLVLLCTGGIPTPVGLPVPQVNFTIFLNTDLTSKVTAASQFSEALLLVDEPNSGATVPQHPVLNCGQAGAADNGPDGPGVCSIVSNGNFAQTYDGTPNVSGVGSCTFVNTYGCGRPNAFQAQLVPAGSLNVVTFLNVPADPPGVGTRTFRFTNLRANVSALGVPPPLMATQIHALVTGPPSITISGPDQIVGFGEPGLIATIPSHGVVRVTEGFAAAWKDKNISFTVGNGGPGNAMFLGGWSYNGGTNYPPDLAQNVPGTIYNDEDMFQWQNNGLNGPPFPNPPPGFGATPVLNLGMPLDSIGVGGVNTGIIGDGVASAGTRIALSFDHLPHHATMDCPSVVHLQRSGTSSPDTGVMVLTTTDTNGAGPFSPAIGSSVPSGDLAVYEILYADPFIVESADIGCTLNTHGHGGGAGGVRVTPSFAPFYSSPSAGRPTPTVADPTPTAVPRFQPGTVSLHLH